MHLCFLKIIKDIKLPLKGPIVIISPAAGDDLSLHSSLNACKYWQALTCHTGHSHTNNLSGLRYYA